MPKQIAFNVIALFILLSSLTSCHIAQKMDAYVGDQFNNKVPKPDKRTDTTILVRSSILPIRMSYHILLSPVKIYSCWFTGNMITVIPVH
jgi:hypothetical protein